MKIIFVAMACALALSACRTSEESQADLRTWQEAQDKAFHESIAEHNKEVERKTAARRKECEAKGVPAIGMTKAQVSATCWGKPSRINTTTTANGSREQLVYGLNAYVYLTNGIVTAIQH